MSILEGASNFIISGYARLYEIHGDAVINHITDPNELKKIQSIVNLPRAHAGRKDYDTKRKIGQCFPGTRKALLQEMMYWVTDPGDSRMYALSGLAGIGKSTVVYTVATQADELDLLGASFFFSRDEADRRNAKKFFTTIAYQLCLFNEEFAQAISGVLVTESGSTATTASPHEQLQTLILDPLRTVVTSNTRRVLIVVDALDECDDKDVPSILTGLRQIVKAFPSFKVILSTRPLLDNNFATKDTHKIFYLQDIEDKIVNDDIRLYLKHSLSREQVKAQLRDPTMQWCASDAQIESLVQATGKLFIIASTAVRYILDQHWSAPARRIKTLLDAFAQGRTPFNNLSDFYTVILRSAVPANCDDEELVERYQAIVSMIVFAQVPLSVPTLSSLVGVEAEEIYAVLRQLQSVILIGADNIPVIYHKSFPDYITDSKRCQDVNLRIDPLNRHTWITIRCFEIMKRHLRYNILGLGDPARFMSNIDGLAKDGITNEQLEENISQQLRYACVYWGNHIEIANVEEVGLMNSLELFTNQHMLHWFEALSLIEMLDSAHRAIRAILKVLKPTSSDLRQLLSDGLRFISKFYEVIKGSALHTYYSALPCTPTNSLLYRVYIKKASHNFCNVVGGPDNWDALVANLSHGTLVEVVKFSADSTLFVTWTSDAYLEDHPPNYKPQDSSSLKVWDAITGTPISRISGEGFAITNDFSTIASFHYNTILLHNVNGSEQGARFTTRAQVLQVAIFRSGSTSRIAAALSGGSVCLWNSSNGELVGSFDGYKRPYRSRHRLEFSGTGARFAYTSANDVVKLRDGIDGRLIADLHDSWDFAFSGDGSRIVTWTYRRVKLWSCEDGERVGTSGDVSQSKLAISTDGSLIATGDNKKVELWSGSGNPLPRIEVLSIESAGSMTFSQDDTLAIATDNITLYNIKTRTMSKLSFSFSHELAISPDCSHLAAASTFSNALYLWDLRHIEASSPSTNVQIDGYLSSLALSPDCSRIAWGFSNGAVGTLKLKEIDGLQNQLKPGQNRDHSKAIQTLEFSPDGRRFVSGSSDGMIKVWGGKDGALRGTLRYPYQNPSRRWILKVGLSNRVVAAADVEGLVLWDRETLDQIHTVKGYYGDLQAFSSSANGALLAAARDGRGSLVSETIVFDVANGTTIATVDVHDFRRMTFLPDNSQLLIQQDSGDDVLAFDLVNKKHIQGPTLEDFIKLCNMPLWDGIPVEMADPDRLQANHLQALFSQHNSRVPVLWIPDEFRALRWAQRRSMIALGCKNGRIILIRPYTRHRK